MCQMFVWVSLRPDVLKNCLQRSVEKGYLEQITGKGASGTFQVRTLEYQFILMKSEHCARALKKIAFRFSVQTRPNINLLILVSASGHGEIKLGISKRAVFLLALLNIQYT